MNYFGSLRAAQTASVPQITQLVNSFTWNGFLIYTGGSQSMDSLFILADPSLKVHLLGPGYTLLLGPGYTLLSCIPALSVHYIICTW